MENITENMENIMENITKSTMEITTIIKTMEHLPMSARH